MTHSTYTPRRYWSEAIVVTFVVALAAWWLQHNPLDVQISQHYFDDAQQYFPYELHSFIYNFGEYYIWFLPFGLGALWWLLALYYRHQPAKRNIFIALGLVFVGTPLASGVIKQFTAMPRPFMSDSFGGDVALYGDFWATPLGKGGGALPSVHATSGFIFMSFYFVAYLRQQYTLRWVWLGLGVLAGLVFGWLRIMQGYHFLSQVLWAGAWVWLVIHIVFAPLVFQQPAWLMRWLNKG